MYEALFGLKKTPFAMTPDARMLLLTPTHREALAGLCYAVAEGKGFVVLCGDAGTGKTTLLRRLRQTLEESRTETSVIINPTLSPAEFLEAILMGYFAEVPASKAQRLEKLRQRLMQLRRERRTAVLIVDEAHKLNPELLEEIRLLTNFETADQKLLQIVLAGQTELNGILNQTEMRQLKQRIAVRLQIRPLMPEEVSAYLKLRWSKCGATTEIPFTADAISSIAAISKGIPRLVNVICDNALVFACSEDVERITAKQVDEVARELQLVPTATDEEMKVELEPTDVVEQPSTQAPTPMPQIPPMIPISLPMLERYAPPRRQSWIDRWAGKMRFATGQAEGR